MEIKFRQSNFYFSNINTHEMKYVFQCVCVHNNVFTNTLHTANYKYCLFLILRSSDRRELPTIYGQVLESYLSVGISIQVKTTEKYVQDVQAILSKSFHTSRNTLCCFYILLGVFITFNTCVSVIWKSNDDNLPYWLILRFRLIYHLIKYFSVWIAFQSQYLKWSERVITAIFLIYWYLNIYLNSNQNFVWYII